MGHRITDNHLRFILGGNAIFTIKNEQTQNRYTYKFVKATRNPKIFWVKLLTTSDNENGYTYLGNFSIERGYSHSPRSRIGQNSMGNRAISWYLKWLVLGKLPDYISTYHEGRCGRCGRTLTVPESITSGFGPECIHHILNINYHGNNNGNSTIRNYPPTC